MSILPTLLSALALMQLTPMTEAGRAVQAEEAARLADCIALMETDPEAAYEDGLAWLGNGARPAARHCTALALIEIGRVEEGAIRLEDLANAPDAGGLEERTQYLAQAGNAWLMAGLPDAAIITLDNALKLKPGNPALLKDRAAARLALENWHLAIDDLDAVIDAIPSDIEALELRARARLALEQYSDALADVETARLFAPENLTLTVLRGEIRNAAR